MALTHFWVYAIGRKYSGYIFFMFSSITARIAPSQIRHE